MKKMRYICKKNSEGENIYDVDCCVVLRAGSYVDFITSNGRRDRETETDDNVKPVEKRDDDWLV